jgi:transposase InsO family protein
MAKKREITAPNQLWEIDIKYVYITGEDRFFFIMNILDVYDRMIIDYHTGLSCTGRDAAYILSRAFTRRSPEGKVVVRTDNGPQFISMAFETACENSRWSMSAFLTVHPIVMLTLRHSIVFWRKIVCRFMSLRTLQRHITQLRNLCVTITR